MKYFFLAHVTEISPTEEIWDGQDLKTGENQKWVCKKEENKVLETWTCELSSSSYN